MDMLSEFLDGCKEHYEQGGSWALMQAISVCAQESIPLPNWAAKAFLEAYEKARVGNAKSWDDVLGTPYPKGANLSATRKRHKLQQGIFDRICEIKEAAPETAIDEQLFSRVGPEFGIGKTLASEYYYRVKNMQRGHR